MTKKTIILHLAGIALLQAIWWLVIPDSVKQRIDWPLQDYLTRYVATPQGHFDPRIVIIDIDEKSLTELGRWPWPRNTIATLIQHLQHHYQVHLIGSDIIFPDTSQDQDLLEKSIANAPITTTLLWHPDSIIRKGSWPGQVSCTECSDHIQVHGWITNTQALTAKEQAHITPEIDADGAVRRIKPIVCYQQECVEMLALSLYRQVLQLNPEYHMDKRALSDTTGIITLPLLNDGSYLINWHQPAGKVSYISAIDVIDQKANTKQLKGAIAIIGSSAAGLHDLVPTPLAARFPAVEIHGLLLQSMLDQQHQQHTPHANAITYIFAFWLTAILLLAAHQQVLMKSIPILIIANLLWIFWISHQYTKGYLWPITPAIISSLISLGWLLPFALKQQTQLKEMIHKQFSSYVPPAVVKQLIQTPDQVIGITPQRHQVTVLFADLRHFSRYSETKSPEELATVLRLIMDKLTDIVHQHDGTVDKYIGDAIMAFWGAPLAQSDHANKAITAAVEMYHCIDTMTYHQLKLPCSLSIGLNTGDVVVGDLGSSSRRSYSLCGTAVNEAAHLEELTRKIQQPILVGEATYQNISQEQREQYPWHPLIELSVSAHSRPLRAYPLDPFKTSR